MSEAADNLLFYGDNLEVLRGRHQDGRPYIPDESVDLIYLDPPFNSAADYNAFLPEKTGTRSAAQLKAFKDTWTWAEAAADYMAFVASNETPEAVRDTLRAFHKLAGGSPMMAYLTMMAPRLVELRKKLKPTGSLYLHCDPTASHYLKLLLDAVFGPVNFRNEIVWKRSHAHNSAKRYGPNHDVIFFYGRSAEMRWKPVYQRHDADYLKRHYRHVDAHGRRYKHENPTGAGVRAGVTGRPWRGIDPTVKGRHWAKTHEEMDRLDAAGLIYWPAKAGGWPYLKVYLDERKGTPAQDVWTDIDPINMMSAERLGYPTQKPLALLERILQASSAEGGIVLDPFCGCGTTIESAQKLGRRWIGIDISAAATTLIKDRLQRAFGPAIGTTYRVIGEPATAEDAVELAKADAYQFQWWALGLVGARPVEQKKGGDKGIDGKLIFHDDVESVDDKEVLFSVKAGQQLNPGMVRDLAHVVAREEAAIGVLLTMREPTDGMRGEAAGAGSYVSPFDGRGYPKIQLMTVSDLIAGRQVQLPPSRDIRTFKKAPRSRRAGPETGSLFGRGAGPRSVEEPGDLDAEVAEEGG